MDKLIALIQGVLEDIQSDVLGTTNYYSVKERNALFDSIMSRYDSLSEHLGGTIPQEIVNSYRQGFNEANVLAEAEGFGKLQGSLKGMVHLEAVQDLAISTVLDLQAAIRTAQQIGIHTIESELRNTQDLIAKGLLAGNPKDITASRVAEAFRSVGMTSFITRDGKRLPLDFYSQTVVRTKQKQANVQGAINRYLESGVTLVQVSRHGATCVECAKREGMILSLTGEHEGVPKAEVVGLPPYHPNCQHSIKPIVDLAGREIRPWRPNTDSRSELQKRNYQEEQAIRRKANEEKKAYAKLVAQLGDDAPKTIGAYRRMKRANDEKWQDLQRRYKESVQALRPTKAINPAIQFNSDDLAKVIENVEEPKFKTSIYKRHVELENVNVTTNTVTFSIDGVPHMFRNEKDNAKAIDRIASHKDYDDLLGKMAGLDVTPEVDAFYEQMLESYILMKTMPKIPDYPVALTTMTAESMSKAMDNVKIYPPDEYEALKDYTGSLYEEINSHLRFGNNVSGYVKDTIAKLDKAMERDTLDRDVLLLRGSDIGIFSEEIQEGIWDNPEMLVGTTFHDKGFMSTSISATNGFYKNGLLFHIKAPKGTKGAFVQPLSEFGSEYEFLLPRGTTLKIVESRLERYTVVLTAEVVQK